MMTVWISLTVILVHRMERFRFEVHAPITTPGRYKIMHVRHRNRASFPRQMARLVGMRRWNRARFTLWAGGVLRGQKGVVNNVHEPQYFTLGDMRNCRHSFNCSHYTGPNLFSFVYDRQIQRWYKENCARIGCRIIKRQTRYDKINLHRFKLPYRLSAFICLD